MRNSGNHHEVLTCADVRHLHIVVVHNGRNKQKVNVRSVSGAENNGTGPLSTDFPHTFQRLLIHNNLLVHRREDKLHSLCHPLQGSMVVVRRYRVEALDCCRLDLSVDFVFGHFDVKGAAIVLKSLFDHLGHSFLN